MTLEFLSTLEKLDISLPKQAFEQLDTLCQLLLEKNKLINLTALKTLREVELRHFADSIIQTKFADFSGKTVIDIGTGAGFPGLPIKIAVPDIHLTLLESLQKKTDVVLEFCAHLGLTNCQAVCGRAEEHVSLCREQFDISVSRAVAPLNILLELCMPYVKPGGCFLAMKGGGYKQELDASANAIKALGGQLDTVHTYTIDQVDFFTVVIQKKCETPNIYPRKYAKICKNPL